MTTNMIRGQQIHAAISLIQTLAEAIRTAGSIPNGHLYAYACGTVDIDQYTQAIRILKGAGLVSETGHMLTWTGPALETTAEAR